MRTYHYAAKVPTEGLNLAEQQLIMAHRYGEALKRIERDRRATVDPIYGALAERKSEDPESMPSWDEALTVIAANEQAADAVRLARGGPDVPFWGTYLCVEDAAQRSRMAGGDPPHPAPYDGTGTLAVQLQGGLTIADLEAGDDARARLLPYRIPNPLTARFPGNPARRRVLWMRIGSDGRAPIWLKVPIIYLRPLPPKAVVKWIRVIRTKVARRLEYAAQFILDGECVTPLPKPTRGTIAVDVGWRRFSESHGGDGLRVACWVDDSGDKGELRLPERFLARWSKCHDLASIRDKAFDDMVAALTGAARAAEEAWPGWLREKLSSAHLWKSHQRLLDLHRVWLMRRFDGDEEQFASLAAWSKKEHHLWIWQASQTKNVLAARKEIYRAFSRFCAKYQTIVLEKLDLREFAEVPEPDSEGLREDPAVTAARPRRHFSALSTLSSKAGLITDAAKRSGSTVLRLPPQHTTTTCQACGQVDSFDATKLEVTCSRCGVSIDQDERAALNLLARAARWQAGTLDRSLAPKDAPAKTKSTAAERRAKGLATRRARRSQKAS